MVYRNISENSQHIVSKSVKTLVAPGETVYMSHSDLRSSGFQVRYFESVDKSEEADKLVETTPMVEPAVVAPEVEEPVAPEPVVVPEPVIVPETEIEQPN